MTVKELIEELEKHNQNDYVLVAGDTRDVHYEITDIYLSYDEDHDDNVVLICSD